MSAPLAVGRANFLFDRSQPIHLGGDELATLTGVPKTTMANKARRICDLVDLGPLDFEFSRRDLLQRNPRCSPLDKRDRVAADDELEANFLAGMLRDEARVA